MYMDNNTAVVNAQLQYDNEKKESTIAWVLWWFLGIFGGHRFYLGHTGLAVGMLLTLGGLGVWTLIDAFFLGKAIKRENNTKRVEIFERNGLQAPSY